MCSGGECRYRKDIKGRSKENSMGMNSCSRVQGAVSRSWSCKRKRKASVFIWLVVPDSLLPSLFYYFNVQWRNLCLFLLTQHRACWVVVFMEERRGLYSNHKVFVSSLELDFQHSQQEKKASQSGFAAQKYRLSELGSGAAVRNLCRLGGVELCEKNLQNSSWKSRHVPTAPAATSPVQPHFV